MRALVFVAIVTVLLGVDSSAADGSKYRCGGTLVRRGSSPSRVLSLCGRPAQLLESSEWVQRAERSGNRIVSVGRTVQVQQWTFRPEAGKFVTTLRFENGRLVNVHTGSRLPQASADRALARCRQQMFRRKTPAGEVMLVCGEPDDRSQWIEERIVGERDAEIRVQVSRERWVYNYGRDSFVRIFAFENGRLISQSTGPRGF